MYVRADFRLGIFRAGGYPRINCRYVLSTATASEHTVGNLSVWRAQKSPSVELSPAIGTQ